ncbi:alkaline phosphatase [Pedobacter sp. CAN_A7]|uniref:alkaline phosphatase n=1 Tax=Pedobacter sp. CAN_A7 TaxID=2787722 RepID=UPI001A220227
MVKKTLILFTLSLCLLFSKVEAQTGVSFHNGHSHNDYHQPIPLLSSYQARMGSIEADVFLKNGQLYVAHDSTEISQDATLRKLYLQPLAEFYVKNGNTPYPDPAQKLQLVIDVKEDYQHVLPVLIKELQSFNTVFDQTKNAKAITIAISGDMPLPAAFQNYPEYIFFDGRPNIEYTPAQLKRVVMISDDIKNHTAWNGKGTPTNADKQKLKSIVEKAHQQQKPFRFWGTADGPNTWLELKRLGVDWINTDQPKRLHDFYQHKDKLSYTNPVTYPVYQPTYKSDGTKKKVKNVILLIGDGMGLAQVHAGWIANHGNLNMTMIRHHGFSETSASNSGNTDSAAGATAMAVGEKTNNRYIGMGPDDKNRTNLPDTLAHYGLKSGIISSADVTDATPAAFYAHQTDRSFNQAIAKDLLHSRVEILVGSGGKNFIANADTSLMSSLNGKGYTWSRSMDQFKQQTKGKQLVLLADSATRPIKDGRGDMLVQSLNKTISLLAQGKKGFFIMAEGAQIDYGGHANDLPYVVTELHDFDKAVAAALQFADEDGETLVLVTADHETGGLTLLEASAEQGSVLGEFSTNDHTNIMVPVYAYGPQSFEFIGAYSNTAIFHKILKVLALGKGKN